MKNRSLHYVSLRFEKNIYTLFRKPLEYCSHLELFHNFISIHLGKLRNLFQDVHGFHLLNFHIFLYQS